MRFALNFKISRLQKIFMRLNGSIVNWIVKQNRNHTMSFSTKIIRRVVTIGFPILFTKMYYFSNKQKGNPWAGKKSCLTLSWDCDLLEDIKAMPQILDSLAHHSIKSSFACIGKWIERNPDIHRRLLREGHEIVNHTYTHPSNPMFCPDRRFDELSIKEQEEEIVNCHYICEKVLNYKPIGFRAPHFVHTEYTNSILVKIGYQYTSSQLANKMLGYGKPFFVNNSLLEFPLSFYPGEPFSAFETWHFFRAPGTKVTDKTEDNFFKMFKLLVDIGIETNSYVNIYLDPIDVIKFKDFGRFLIYLTERKTDLWIAKYQELTKFIKSRKFSFSG